MASLVENTNVIIVVTDETKGVKRKNKSDSAVAVVPGRKIRRKKLKKKLQKSNRVSGSTNAFGNYCCILCTLVGDFLEFRYITGIF